MLAKIYLATPFIQAGHLKVRLLVKSKKADFYEAILKDREIATLLPRSLLLGTERQAPYSLLGIIKALLQRMLVGRIVYLKNKGNLKTVVFLSWKKVTFSKNTVLDKNSSVQAKFHKPQLH